MPLNFGALPNRGTSEQELNQWNQNLRVSPFYQDFLRRNSLVDSGRGVQMSRGQQSALEKELAKQGITIPGGMHIDQGGNLNQKNRLGRNLAIAAAIGAGGYFAAPYIAGALGAGGAAGGAGAAGAGAAGAGAAGTAAGTAGLLGTTGWVAPMAGYAGTATSALGGLGAAGALGAGAAGLGGAGLLAATPTASGFAGLAAPVAASGTGIGGAAGAGGGIMSALGGKYGQLAQLGLSAASGAMGDKQSSTSTSMPQLDPAFAPLQGGLLQLMMQRLQSQDGLPPGYENRGLRDINRTHELTAQRNANNLTARGLGQSPIAGAVEGRAENNRTSDIVQFQESLPILARQFQNEDLMHALSILGMGRGQSNNSTQTSGGGWGGALSSAGSMLGLMMALRGGR